jgi:glycine oxidase
MRQTGINQIKDMVMNLAEDILIIGGGIIGLSLAIELKLRGASVTVLSRNCQEAAARAAAGMLAPQAEEIPPSPMLDLCLKSRSLYPDWITKLESLTGLNSGYWDCGILAPIYESVKGIKGNKFTENAYWLDEKEVHKHLPGLSAEVKGGWWYPDDGQVDNRALYEALKAAVNFLKIEIIAGNVTEFLHNETKILGVKTSQCEYQASHYVLTTGAWTQELLPMIPVYPTKGQMLSISPPDQGGDLPLKNVLFGEEIYVVPRRDGKIVLGATSENVGFTSGNTSAGIQALLQGANRLFPQLKDYQISEFWWGFRPATPDELPILGSSEWDNLTLATGHYRNGILLAPVTVQLIADLILDNIFDPLLSHFLYSRFSDN